ncbi:MAG TPA: dipicolinate synthase subunit DpsA [Actinomycetota bacterium]|nr:dipicolinate synthase subunit DpsA [Actinomycetota bacterium]
MRWGELTIAVVGGDERERVIARLAAETGATVRGYGFPWPEGGVPGVDRAPDPGRALQGAHYALFPVPGLSEEGALYAPAAPAPILPGVELLRRMAPGAHVFLGRADDRLRAAAAEAGVTLHEYEHDRELMLLRGPAIVEGALQLAIEATEVTIHGSTVCVVGYGTIGGLLARTLVLLGARVYVAARNPVQRAHAYASGATPVPLEELPAVAPRLAMLFSTVPVRVVGAEVLERLPRGTLVMDLAAPPGGVDLERARALGHRAVWARGLGARAPVTVGTSQWRWIEARIREIEAGRAGREGQEGDGGRG